MPGLPKSNWSPMPTQCGESGEDESWCIPADDPDSTLDGPIAEFFQVVQYRMGTVLLFPVLPSISEELIWKHPLETIHGPSVELLGKNKRKPPCREERWKKGHFTHAVSELLVILPHLPLINK